MHTATFMVVTYAAVLIWATACAYFDPPRYARNHRVLSALGVAAMLGYST